MPELGLLDCLQPELVKLKRVKYFERQLLTADDMVTDQDYFRQKLRRHNRFLHGWGVVCGLGVVADPSAEAPWRVTIEPGYALGPQGDEIFVSEAVHIDLAECGPGAVTDPCDPAVLRPGASSRGSEIFLAIRYSECVANPVRALPAGCGCEEEICEYSRVCDSFQIECLEELPPSHQPNPDPVSLCDLLAGGQIVPCLPCPSEPWVVLARVTLPASATTEIADGGIDNSGVRRRIFSTAVIQEQLIECCCDGEPGEEADLRITQTGVVVPSPTTAILMVEFTTLIENLGPATSNDIVFSDSISVPGGSIFEGLFDAPITPAGQWTQNQLPGPPPPSTLELEATLPQLAAGATAIILFQLRIRRGQATVLTSGFSVAAATPDPDLSNNSGQLTLELGSAELPDLEPTLELGANGIEVRVRNLGAGGAPESITRVQFSSGEVMDLETAPIPAGGQVALSSVPIPTGCFSPDCSVTVTANAPNDFNETTRDNNTAAETFIG